MNKTKNNMIIGIHQVPKSPWQFILLSLQHLFAMVGANILVPILVNQNAGMIVIPIQVAFLCSGVGTIIYLLITGFKVPIYLGSSFAFLGGMTTLYATTSEGITGGYNIFFALMIIGLIYVIVSMVIFFTKKASVIKKILSPIIIGPAIMMIGWSLISNAATDAFINPGNITGDITSDNIDLLWSMISISLVTFIIVIISMIFLKGIWKMIPILLGLIGGIIFSAIVWSIATSVGNKEIADALYGSDNPGVVSLLNPGSWKWYPDITTMWKANITNPPGFKLGVYLALVPLVVVTLSEHIGDHINIGQLTKNDFIEGKPGLHRTLLGDGIATIVSAAFGGPANTSYGENTSVISITKVASVWVILSAAIMSIFVSFLAPISQVLSVIPKPVLGGVEMILYTMIGINGLRILINAKLDMFDPKNIIIMSVMVVAGLGGTVLIFLPKDVIDSTISLSGTGVGVIISMILNLVLPSKGEGDSHLKSMIPINFSPIDFMNIKQIQKNKINKNKKTEIKQNILLKIDNKSKVICSDFKEKEIKNYLYKSIFQKESYSQKQIIIKNIEYLLEKGVIIINLELEINKKNHKKYHIKLSGFKKEK